MYNVSSAVVRVPVFMSLFLFVVAKFCDFWFVHWFFLDVICFFEWGSITYVFKQHFRVMLKATSVEWLSLFPFESVQEDLLAWVVAWAEEDLNTVPL